MACEEKIKMLNQNMEELSGLIMACDVDQFRSAVVEMVGSLESSFAKPD